MPKLLQLPNQYLYHLDCFHSLFKYFLIVCKNFQNLGNSEIFKHISFNLSIGNSVNYSNLESINFLINAHYILTQFPALYVKDLDLLEKASNEF